MSGATFAVPDTGFVTRSIPGWAASLAGWAMTRLRLIAVSAALVTSCLLGVLRGQESLDLELRNIRSWNHAHLASINTLAVMGSLADMDAREGGGWDIVFERNDVRAYMKGGAVWRFVPLDDDRGDVIFGLNMFDRVPLMRARLGPKDCKGVLHDLSQELHGDRIEYRAVVHADGAWRKVDDGGKGCQADDGSFTVGMDFRIAPAPPLP